MANRGRDNADRNNAFEDNGGREIREIGDREIGVAEPAAATAETRPGNRNMARPSVAIDRQKSPSNVAVATMRLVLASKP